MSINYRITTHDDWETTVVSKSNSIHDIDKAIHEQAFMSGRQVKRIEAVE